MNEKASLAVILISLLLSQNVCGIGWQGTGQGMNRTVISEIWNGLESNLDVALNTGTPSGFNFFTKQISDRLTGRWDKAWNVVLVMSSSQFDSVLYGYAFRNQWMWYNGVPNTVLPSNAIITLIVWKDYNCQTWANVQTGNGGFSSEHITQLSNVLRTLTYQDILNDIWGSAQKFVNGVQAKPELPSGAYTVVMSQDTGAYYYGRVCLTDNYYAKMENLAYQSGKLIGSYFLFKTR